MTDLPPIHLLRHVVDVHCHPTDAPRISPESMERLQIRVCAMSCREKDQMMVRNLAINYPSKVTPCFGYHPYFSHYIATDSTVTKEEYYKHLFSDPLTSITPDDRDAFDRLLPLLPSPRPLSEVVEEMRQNLAGFPDAMVGEVGLDQSVHVSYDYDATPREYTPFKIPLDHQLSILEAQIDLAVELGRNVSMHNVHSQQATIDLLNTLAKKHGDSFYRISIDMHSCSLSPDSWKTIERKHPNIFLSLSARLNGRSSASKMLIASCADDRIMVESDSDDIDKCTPQTWDMIKIIAQVKMWNIETTWLEPPAEVDFGVIRRLEQNWSNFRKGHHTPPSSQQRS